MSIGGDSSQITVSTGGQFTDHCEYGGGGGGGGSSQITVSIGGGGQFTDHCEYGGGGTVHRSL